MATIAKPLQEHNMMSPVQIKSPSKKKKRLSVERIYQKKTQLEHILLRPDTYIGSVEPNTENMWVFDEATKSIVNRPITFVPGLYKIFDEILVNAADNKQRDSKMSTIKINIDPEQNVISIWNDGRGIPVEMHKEQKVYVPTLIFGQLLTSSNYDDDQKKVTGGRNGYGAKLCNIFSTKFSVETSASESGKHFKQTWTNNMTKTGEPKIKDAKGKDFTCVTFKPDLERLKMESLDSDTVALLTRRAYDIAGASRGVTVILNGEKIKIHSFKEYVDLYLKSAMKDEEYDDDKKPKIIHEVVNKRWEVCVTVSHKGFQQASFVNSIATTKGGTHVNYVTDQIVDKLLVHVKKKQNKGGVSVKPFQIRNHLWVFINCLIENPSFDSQTKENMTLRAKAFGSTCELNDKFIKSVQNCGVMENIMNWVKFKAQSQLNKKCHSTKHSKLKGIPKLDDANNAGTKSSINCTLILTEGDSAKTLAVSGLSVVGRDSYGVFPLRGKLLNVRDASHKQILENAEINSIIKILGLQYNKKYNSIEDLKSLRYGKLMIMTDQDQDGSHIKGLLVNFIHTNWPSLLRLPFLEQFITPIVKVTKAKQEISFYSIPEFEEWQSSTDNAKSWKVKYYKGLGTSTPKEAKEYFADMKRHRIKFTYEGSIDDEAIVMAFSKKKIMERKDWLTCGLEERKMRRQAGMPEMYLYEKDTTEVTYNGFINKELILFSNTDNERSIPSLVDGFKPGQRKVLFTCFKRNDKREVKVAQLAGSIAELSAYHHGEQSLMGTIINLAQNYVGSNNINVLQPIGQFGTRIHGGKDAASPRYIFTMLSPLARLIFPVHDDYSLKFLMDDNQRIEPEWYIPILPMVLVNGADGIGTGYSTKIPNFDPRDIVSNLRKMLNGEEPTEMMPSYKNFVGSVTQVEAQKYAIRGVINVVDTTTLEIEELPVGVWTQTYKENVLEPMLHGTEKVQPSITDYKEHHTDTTVRFVVTMTEEKLAEAEQMGLHKKFKLESNCNTSNMVMFDADGCLRKYDNTKAIMREFFDLRLDRYCIRKTYLEAMLLAEATKLENQARFILEKIDGEIVIENRTKRDLIVMLVQRGYASDPVKTWKETLKADGGAVESEDDASSVASSSASAGGPDFNYLLGMALWSLSKEKKDELLKQRDEKKEELDILRRKTPEDLWASDLDVFLEELERLEQQEREDEENAVKPKAGRSQKAAKPKARKQTSVKAAFKEVSREKAEKENKKEETANAAKETTKKAPVKKAKSEATKEVLETVKEDSFEFQEEEKPMLTLIDRLAMKKKPQSSSAISVASSTASKKQSTLDGFGKKAAAAKTKKFESESDDDLILDFSDDDVPPPRRPTQRNAAKNQRKFSFSSDEDSFEAKGKAKDDSFVISDDDDADFDIGKKKAAKKAKKAGKPKKKTPAVLDSDDEMEKNSASTPDSGSESEKSDVLATRALIEKLTPTKKKKAKGSLQASSSSEVESVVSTEVVCATAPEEPAAKLQRKLLSKKVPAKSKGKKADTAQPTLMETLNKSAEKRRNEATTSQDENNDILPGKAKKTKQPAKPKSKTAAAMSSESDEKSKAAPSRKRKGPTKGKAKALEVDSDSDGSVVVTATKTTKTNQKKPKKSSPKKKKVQLSSDEDEDFHAELDNDEEEPIPRPARQRRARAPTKYNFGEDSDEENDDTNDWMGSDDDDDSDF